MPAGGSQLLGSDVLSAKDPNFLLAPADCGCEARLRRVGIPAFEGNY
jgi:hypothetical protein